LKGCRVAYAVIEAHWVYHEIRWNVGHSTVSPSYTPREMERTYFSSHQISLRMPSQKLTPLVAVPWPFTLSHQATGWDALPNTILGISRSRNSHSAPCSGLLPPFSKSPR